MERFQMLRLSLLTLAITLSAVLPAISAESVLSQYRGVTLGDSVQIVIERLKLSAAEVKIVHERPVIVQELTSRPSRFISGSTLGPDPLTEIVFTFYEGRLARISVVYDRERTQGLTNEDLQEAMALVYGPSILISTRTQAPAVVAYDRQTIGQWEDSEARLLLWRERYPARVGLTITSIAGDQALQDGIAAGQRLHAAEAPALELARRTAEAAAVQAKDEKIRRENKAGFKP
jgi:hypothetical protein